MKGWFSFEWLVVHIVFVLMAVLGIVLAANGMPVFSQSDGGLGAWICWAPLAAILFTDLQTLLESRQQKRRRGKRI